MRRDARRRTSNRPQAPGEWEGRHRRGQAGAVAAGGGAAFGFDIEADTDFGDADLDATDEALEGSETEPHSVTRTREAVDFVKKNRFTDAPGSGEGDAFLGAALTNATEKNAGLIEDAFAPHEFRRRGSRTWGKWILDWVHSEQPMLGCSRM
jgi:hypothetical protein